MQRTELEDTFAVQLKLAGIPFVREFKAVEGRRFRWDFLIAGKLLVEIQGGIWLKAGHSTGVGITRDAEKLNMATLAGYAQMAFVKEHIVKGQALKWVQQYLS